MENKIINDYNQLFQQGTLISMKKLKLAKMFFEIKYPDLKIGNIILKQIHDDCPLISEIITDIKVSKRNLFLDDQTTYLEAEFCYEVKSKNISTSGIIKKEWDFNSIDIPKKDWYIFKFICNINDYEKLTKEYKVPEKLTKHNVIKLYKKMFEI